MHEVYYIHLVWQEHILYWCFCRVYRAAQGKKKKLRTQTNTNTLHSNKQLWTALTYHQIYKIHKSSATAQRLNNKSLQARLSRFRFLSTPKNSSSKSSLEASVVFRSLSTNKNKATEVGTENTDLELFPKTAAQWPNQKQGDLCYTQTYHLLLISLILHIHLLSQPAMSRRDNF